MLKIWQYKEINDIERGHFDKMISLVSVYLNIDESEVLKWKSKTLIDAYQNAQNKCRLSDKYSQEIEIENTKFRLISFSRFTLGQFIDIESLVNDGEIKNLSKIIASLYLIHSENGIIESEIEKYSKVNIEYRAELIEEININLVYGALKKYLNFREKFFKSYELFNDPLDGINQTELDAEELAIFKEEIKEREKNSKNQWETMLNILSDNDITKFTTILNTNLHLCFNQLSYLKSNNK